MQDPSKEADGGTPSRQTIERALDSFYLRGAPETLVRLLRSDDRRTADRLRLPPEILEKSLYLLRERAQKLRLRHRQRTVRLPGPDSLSQEEIRTFELGGFNFKPVDLGAEDPLIQAEALYERLIKKSFSVNEAATRLGVQPDHIRRRLASHPPSLYGIQRNSRWHIPSFQFDGDQVLPGIEQIVAVLDLELHPTTVYNWFVTPSPDLVAEDPDNEPLSPRAWLRLGLPAKRVVEIAEHL